MPSESGNRICPNNQPALDSTFTPNRMEANHVHRSYGKEHLRELRRFSLPAPSARGDATLSVGVEALPGVQAAIGPGRQGAAWLTRWLKEPDKTPDLYA